MNKKTKNIWNFGEWVWVKSPLKGDKSKENNSKQKRIACILGYNPETQKFKVQMLTNRDLEDSNWILIRKNEKIISGRNHYKVNVNQEKILGPNKYLYESNLTDKEINILVSIKNKEVYKSDGTFIGKKNELNISTKTSFWNKQDTIYDSINKSPGIKNIISNSKKEEKVKNEPELELEMS